MPYRICKTFEIENGHILTKHPDKCRFPHGHSRTVEIILAADTLDANDMVCDFKAIKDALKSFLDSWDHSLCLNTSDPQFGFYQKNYAQRVIPFDRVDPTSEVMAKVIFDEAKRQLAIATQKAGALYPVSVRVRLERVRISETSSSWAEYSE
jgi:6-pyruvoyltetrahydropterin/6-carboxytetrahydropterin synthase